MDIRVVITADEARAALADGCEPVECAFGLRNLCRSNLTRSGLLRKIAEAHARHSRTLSHSDWCAVEAARLALIRFDFEKTSSRLPLPPFPVVK